MTPSGSSKFRKCCAATLCASLALQPLVVYAAPITTSSLAEVPIQGLNPVKPNIMYTMDDSGSMGLATLPDYLTLFLNPTYTGVPAIGAPNSWCLGTSGAATGCALTSPPFASSMLNRIYYDPAIAYSVGKRSDASDLPLESANAGTWTSVYIDGFAGYPNANTGGTTDLTTSYPDEAFCLADGSDCRYNGKGGAGYDYPDVTHTNRVAQKGNPYYYTISPPVQFCATRDASGWGVSGCVPKWSPDTPYVSYGAGGFDSKAFKRVDIVPFGGTNAYGRTYAEEMTNFARWYAFARTRIQAMKTAAGIAFSALDENTRVGFHTLNTFGTNFLNVQDFKDPHKSTWFTTVYGVVPTGATPSINAMWRIGEYFSNGGVAAGLATATDPLDPDTGKCQSNYHLMSTDGYANQFPRAYTTKLGDKIGDADLTVPSVLPAPIPGFTPGAPFPRPYIEGSKTTNTMGDVAMYYWIHDLRPSMANRVKDSIAPWQHVNFYGLALGAEGTLPYPDAIGDITTGSLDWPTWKNNLPEAIDDLWHAAVNSRGKYFNAQNAQQLAESVVNSLADFTDQAGTGTAVGIAGAQFSATKKYGYRTSYEIGWWGDVRKYALNPATGALDVDADGNPKDAPLWTAATQLDTLAAGTGWNTNRRIVTTKSDGSAIPFRLASLEASQRDSLTNAWATVQNPPTAQKVLDFLRGDRSKEGAGTTNFRVRSHILGDIVYSGAVPVGAPSQPYEDAGNPGYKAFAAANQSRTPMVYVGANDAMLHAFDDSTTANAGTETWAYVPNAVFSAGDPNDTAHTKSPAFQIGALSYRRGGIPLFSHKFYGNATPRIWDVDFRNTNTNNPPQNGNDWRTILVGGLGAGASSVYALDVTTPVSPTETEVDIVSSRRVLWEFKDDQLGYVFDAPTLVKTKRFGWVVLVASGYNNKEGKGILYVLNPTNGRILKKLSPDDGTDLDESSAKPTDTVSDSNPRGLSTIRAFTASRKDPYVLQAYGGDLRGNVWRFDLSDPDESKWKVALIAKLTDPTGKPQPITTGIRIEIDQNNFVDRYLFVGTGMLLSQSDLAGTNPVSNVINTLYVIRDGTVTAAGSVPGTPYSRTDLNSVNGATVTGFSGAATGRGWYHDGGTGEKIGTDVFADVQTVVYSFSKPSSDPCEAALSSNLFARDLLTGNSVIQSQGGDVVASIADIGAIAGVALIQGAGSAAGTTSGDVRAQVTTMKGQVLSFGVRLAGAPNNKHRVSWRLLRSD